jgi:diketogulonate reductase-like aldo/keto reductase
MTELPRLGFGTWQLYGPAAAEGVRDALEVGYRHIDTAWLYENEWGVGRGMKDSGVPRDEIFLTTKLYANAFWGSPPRSEQHISADSLRHAMEHSLLKLDTDYADLLLLHWPSRAVPLAETLSAMVALQEAGLTRRIGVSNFPAGMLRRACDLAPVFCDQVEYHPFLSQDRLLAAARELGVIVVAHSPLAQGRVLQDETLARIGVRRGKTATQVGLRWLVEQDGIWAIPNAVTHEWRVENLAIFDFELTEEDRAEIAALPKDGRTVESIGPDTPDWND